MASVSSRQLTPDLIIADGAYQHSAGRRGGEAEAINGIPAESICVWLLRQRRRWQL